jgi:exodeoxyribonuclease-3
VNGIRAAGRKGFFEWLAQEDPDVVCLQETKAQMAVLLDDMYRPEGYHCYFDDAVKKGYSGVGIYSKQAPDKVTKGLGWDCADNEGRYIQADFGDLSVVSNYLPSGSSREERQVLKFEFMERYEKILREQLASKREFIICGDWNIVHKEIDIKNFKSNQKNSGCLPEEREWLDNLFVKDGFVDAFRVVNQEPHQYTWWSNRGQARANNVGWRIDYQIVTPGLKEKVRAVRVYNERGFADHAPLIVEYEL